MCQMSEGIDDLDQIRECVNIEMLDLSYNDISDVSVLKTLTSLKYLNLTSNQIRHLSMPARHSFLCTL